MSERNKVEKQGILAVFILLLLSMTAFLLLRLLPSGAVAVVERNGSIILRQELSALDSPIEREIQGENGITLIVVLSPDGAAVRSSECPDKICVNTGTLHKAGESAVCLPAKVVLRLEGGSGVDGIS